MNDTLRSLAVYMDPVEPARTLRALDAQHRRKPANRGRDISLRSLLDRHGRYRLHEIRVLTLNTYLMDVAGGLFDTAKPAVEDRAPRIGELVRDHFHVAMLNEVFEDDVKDLVLSAWPDSPPHVVEDAARFTNQSSGLVTISRWPLDHLPGNKVHVYDAESRIGQDGLADKGVMLARLPVQIHDPGITHLEFYSTHLDASDADVRTAQVRELASFVARTHVGRNVAIVAGDFNIDARSAEYTNLVDVMRSVGLDDIWTARNGTAGFTYESDGLDTPAEQQICHRATDDPLYCDDASGPPADHPAGAPRRIDYIFMSAPDDVHEHNVDITRPRRVYHERRSDAPERDQIVFLSDHIGLATTLVVSSRFAL